MKRRDCLTTLLGLGSTLTSCADAAKPKPEATAGGRLPLSQTFKGEEKFRALLARAQANNWAALPIHERTATIGQALVGTPYQNFTLELNDSVESPCVNFNALDCWTFYETSLALARMIHQPGPYGQQDLLRYIELERYRDGKCDGTYLSRLHHLEEVFANNEARGLGRNLTHELGGIPIHREVTEMQHDWKSYRSMVANPRYRAGIAKVEARVSNLPVTYIPNSRVPGVESSLRHGDILAIVSGSQGGYTSHVGMGVKDRTRCRFMHATSRFDKGHRVVLDGTIASYLAESPDHIGIIVFRPYEA